jgi:hypothetical protein
MGYMDSRCPKPRNAEEICTIDLRGDLTIGFFLGMDVGAWMCTMCQRIEKTCESGRTQDITDGDMDPPECAMHHCS